MEEKRNVDDQQMLNNSRNQFVDSSESWAKSCPQPQKGPRSNYVCHHCGLQGHTRPNCQKLRAMNSTTAPGSRGPRNDRRNWAGEPSRDRNGDPGMMDVMKMISAFTNCLESFTRRFESPNSRTQSYHPKCKWRVGEKWHSCISITTCPCINTSYALWLCLVVWLLIVWVEICLSIFAYFHSFFF